MGWRGTLRSIEAASRRASREAERHRKAEQKAMMIADAESAVTEWRAHLHSLVSLHIDPIERVDWHSLRDANEPKPPTRTQSSELAAQGKLNQFRPRFFDFLSGGSEKKRLNLVRAVEEARDADRVHYEAMVSAHSEAVSEWRADKELAIRLLDGDFDAEQEVVSELTSWSADGLIGTSLSFRFSRESLHAVAYVHGDDVVPTFRRKQLQSGKLSETKMPVSQRYELYQDYVCSVALKVAGDLFGVLPREDVHVTCAANMLDKSTGHMVDTPILSVQFVRPTFERLRLSAIDPSDSMANFNHEMNFKKTKGFEAIEPLKPLPDD